MFRRLLVGAFIVVTVAGLAPTAREEPLLAAPNEAAVSSIVFAEGVTQDVQPIGEAIEFRRGVGTVWAVVELFELSSGTNRINWVLRLNEGDYRWGRVDCCGGMTSARVGIPLEGPEGRNLPGGAYRLFIYEGEREIGQAGFGVRGGRGSDNGNAPSNSQGNGNEED